MALPKDTVMQRIIGESALLAGGGRALLMQLANPAVAQGVFEHSHFAKRPLDRLVGTLRASYGVAFGNEFEANHIGARVYEIHRHVHGANYYANDPVNLLWVHATLVDTAVVMYETFMNELRADEKETLYQELKQVGSAFGIPESTHPQTFSDFQDWFKKELAATTVTEQARAVANSVLGAKNLPIPIKPLIPISNFLTIGMLDEGLRAQYQLEWSPQREDRMHRLISVATPIYQSMPWAIRSAPANFLKKQVISPHAPTL